MERSVACSTCRRRKVKCDRKLPKCSACVRLKLDCGHNKATSVLAWVETKDNKNESITIEPEANGRRRALFTDAEREEECARLLEQTSHQEIESLLQDLDGDRTLASQSSKSHWVGPFGVFAIQSQNDPTPRGDSEDDRTFAQTERLNESYPDGTILDIPTIDDQIYTLTEQQLVEYGLFDQGPLTPSLGLGTLEDLFDLTNLPRGTYELPEEHDTFREIIDLDRRPGDIESIGYEETAGSIRRTPSPLMMSFPVHFASDTGHLSSAITSTLLAHYRDKMIPFFLSHKHHKPPWKILHFPTALSAYSEMSLLGDTNNAKASLFFSILAMSALNLEQLRRKDDGSTSQWILLGEMYRDKAKQRLQACLREQSGTVKKAKYKEVLMAILSMATTCVVTGQMEDGRSFLRDAERFIYLKGLPKARKSRKVLMLHGIFLYLRIVEESTCVACPRARLALSNSVYQNLSSDALCRYPTLWTERLKMSLQLEKKDTNNLEMQFMAFPPNIEEPTVFEQIYGIPESLFRMISHATYLANALQRNEGVSTKELDQSIKALESKICSWNNPYRQIATLGPSRSPDEMETRYSLMFDFLEAIHSALMIYFYRRVRDMNTIALQHFVAKTIHHLLEHERRKDEVGDKSANFCWPGFIAACEALDPEQRASITGWLSRSARSSGLGMFDTARDVTTKLWKARGATGNPDMSWQDLIANGDTALILS